MSHHPAFDVLLHFCFFSLFLQQMLPDDTKNKIENITRGAIIEGQQDNCTTIRNLLCASYPTSTTVKKEFESNAIIKKEQAQLIERFCRENGIWVEELPTTDNFLAAGGEAQVYYNVPDLTVTKLNDGVYYATWLEFLNSVLLHNLIFVNTSYILLGFAKDNDKLLAVLRQPFVACDGQADLNDIKEILEYNGFVNTKRQDFVHHELGLILEDMHDENVLVCQDTLFFIDSVFYTISPPQ